ncbi:LuxR C-terminal-related transcriptional regulator [Bifidobacterium amazonense]|uniref:LuxR C-terminal-related transcriptional regulator n=1 Tax=Bifidobacterium amazonense TaxID=2809027 RepID=A0ABS9VVJ5_9BIFI|nr:LuxR C-terminal-related transcriptional regulator [Bifidobacterium amazonense]MCH9276138.1 LuxR C-terminal-related transcriptional regulator [Bifidobacterium amazonense]
MSERGTTRKPVTVAAVDNDRMTLLALKGIMPQLLPESRWLWGVQTAEEAICKATSPETRPDVLLVDMSLGEATGVSVCRTIRRRTDRVALLAITAFSLDTYADRAAAAGAQGIVSKADIPQLAAALRAVAGGGTFTPAEPARENVPTTGTGIGTGTSIGTSTDRSVPGATPRRSFKAGGSAPATAPGGRRDIHERQPTFRSPVEAHRMLVRAEDADQPKLGAKETETLHLLAQGFSYDEIADRWGVAASTVRTHAHRAVDKLNAHSLAHAIALWLSR